MIPQVELFSLCFLEELKTPKRRFEINFVFKLLKHMHFLINYNWVLNAATQSKQQPCVQWYQIKTKPCWALRTQFWLLEIELRIKTTWSWSILKVGKWDFWTSKVQFLSKSSLYKRKRCDKNCCLVCQSYYTSH